MPKISICLSKIPNITLVTKSQNRAAGSRQQSIFESLVQLLISKHKLLKLQCQGSEAADQRPVMKTMLICTPHPSYLETLAVG